MALLKTNGIVLKSINLSDNDKIVTVYTDEFGKIDAVAHGVRKQSGRINSSVLPFCYGEYVLFRGRNLFSVKDAAINESFQGLLMDLDKLSCGLYLLELIDNLTIKEAKNVKLLALLLKSLYILLHGDPDYELLELVVSFKAISMSGYMPNIDYCINCGCAANEGIFDIPAGGILCANCGHNIGDRVLLNDSELNFLRAIKLIRLEELEKLKYDGGLLRKMSDLMHRFIVYHSGKSFKSIDVINKLNK